MQIIDESKLFAGTHRHIRHHSPATQCPMECAVFIPHGNAPDACLIFLSGLTSTWENATTKAGAQIHAARANMALIFPDTSPRGDSIPDAEQFWLGQGAGFYVDATEPPWAPHFSMESYITRDLPALFAEAIGKPLPPLGIMGYSMGGHGALTLAMKHPAQFASLSAMSPISAATQSPWGQQALTAYLGKNPKNHETHDATLLMASRGWHSDILIDQGLEDEFLDEHLKPHLLAEAAARANIPLTLRQHEGYDHSYYFAASFIAGHIDWHAKRLKA